MTNRHGPTPYPSPGFGGGVGASRLMRNHRGRGCTAGPDPHGLLIDRDVDLIAHELIRHAVAHRLDVEAGTDHRRGVQDGFRFGWQPVDAGGVQGRGDLGCRCRPSPKPSCTTR